MAGDRIRMVSTGNDPHSGRPDPCPVEPGTLGTVTRYRFPRLGTDLYEGTVIHGVQWDNGRTLSIILPVDTVEKLDG